MNDSLGDLALSTVGSCSVVSVYGLECRITMFGLLVVTMEVESIVKRVIRAVNAQFLSLIVI